MKVLKTVLDQEHKLMMKRLQRFTEAFTKMIKNRNVAEDI